MNNLEGQVVFVIPTGFMAKHTYLYDFFSYLRFVTLCKELFNALQKTINFQDLYRMLFLTNLFELVVDDVIPKPKYFETKIF